MKNKLFYTFVSLCFSNFILSSQVSKQNYNLDLFCDTKEGALSKLLEHVRKDNAVGYSHEEDVVTVDYKDNSTEKFYLVYSDKLKKYAFQIPQEEIDRKAKALNTLRFLKGETNSYE